MKGIDIQKNYDKIFVLAADGNKYKLKDYYFNCILVENELDMVFLDTGGRMENCNFFRAKIINNELIKECDDKIWRKIATLEIEV